MGESSRDDSLARVNCLSRLVGFGTRAGIPFQSHDDSGLVFRVRNQVLTISFGGEFIQVCAMQLRVETWKILWNFLSGEISVEFTLQNLGVSLLPRSSAI